MSNTATALYTSITLILGCIAIVYARMKHQYAVDRVIPWKAGWLDLVTIIWIVSSLLFLTQGIVSLVVILFHTQNMHIGWMWNTVFASVATQAALVLALVTLMYWKLNGLFDGIQNPVAKPSKTSFNAVLFFFASLPIIGITSQVSYNLLLYLEAFGIGISADRQAIVEVLTASASNSAIAILSLMAILIAPATEELLFRGIIYRFLKSLPISRQYSFLISSLLFAIMHYNMASFFPLLILGLLITSSYEKTGDIRVPIIFHACFNANTIIAIGLFVD